MDHKEGWASKNLDCKEIKPVNPKGNKHWMLIERTDVEAEAPMLWPPDSKNWLIGKDPDAKKDWRWEEKGTTEDKMVGWHHQLNGHEFEHALGDGEEQGRLACYNPLGCKESDMTEQLNNKNPSFQQPLLWSTNNHQHGGKTLHQQERLQLTKNG